MKFLNRKMGLGEHLIGVSMMWSLLTGVWFMVIIDLYLLYMFAPLSNGEDE